MSNNDELTEAEQRRFWRLRWLSGLQAFTDASTQANKWADPSEENPHFSFVECMSCYFDDADLGDQDAYDRRIERGYLSRAEADAVAEFHLVADQYRAPGGDDYDTKAIIVDPAWRYVGEVAQRAQAALLSLLTDSREVAALTKPLIWEKMGPGGFRAEYPDLT